MLILHATFFQHQLVLWGETTPELASKPKSRSAKTQRQWLPYDPGKAVLAQTLNQLGIGKRSCWGKSSPNSWWMWIPSDDTQPLPSSQLIASPPLTISKIAPWKISGLALKPNLALKLLTLCKEQSILAPGIIIGKDLIYWEQALRLAARFVTQQHYLPTLERKEKKYRAVWHPILFPQEKKQVEQLAQAMPGIARAMSLDDQQAPHTPASILLQKFLNEMVDTLLKEKAASNLENSEKPPPSKLLKIQPKPCESLHDQWIHALASSEGFLEGDEKELEAFSQQITRWQEPIHTEIHASYRLCFRLEAPSSSSPPPRISSPRGSWYVRYFIQNVEDPSLLIPLTEVWDPQSDAVHQWLNPQRTHLSHYFLRCLGQAASICPLIESSLQEAKPWGYKLKAHAAHEFLRDKALALEQAGFVVQLPSWWTRQGSKVHFSSKAEVKSPTRQQKGAFSLDTVLSFHWQVALGNEKLSLQELKTLAKLKSPLVQIRGEWVEINPEEMKKALACWRKKDTAALREILGMALIKRAQAPLRFEGVEADGWVGQLVQQLEEKANFEILTAPSQFSGSLRPYQTRGYSWLAFLTQYGLGACLADDMGLGKTIQALALVRRNWTPSTHNPVLLICPTSVVGNWQKEASRFTPDLPVFLHHGSHRKKLSAFQKKAERYGLIITSYSLLHRDLKTFQKMKWSGLILDEAQNIKNAETKQSQAARAIPASYRIALTGTPIENNVGELWSIMEFLNPGFLGSQAEFKRKFLVPIHLLRDTQATEDLQKATGPFILRRLKTDRSIVSDLPDKLEMKVYSNLTREQASLYAAVVQNVEENLKESKGISRKGIILATLTKLKQICNHPAHFLKDNSPLEKRSGKLNRITEMLEEILSMNERALIFTQFTEIGERLQKYWQEVFGEEVLFFHGSLTKKKRDDMVEQFQEKNNGPRLFLLSLKSGGTGLNLTRANHVFHFDRWWNPAVENQATDRAFRIGQTKNVQVHKFVCVGTLEEKIDEMIEDKKKMADQVVGTGENWLTELSNEQLHDLFALQANAVAD